MCAPARAGLLTGRFHHRTGAVANAQNRGLDRILRRERTIADYFKAAGYATGMAGKWHNGAYDMRYHPIRRGFDEVAAGFQGSQWYYDWRLDYNGKTIERADGRYLTDVLTTYALLPRVSTCFLNSLGRISNSFLNLWLRCAELEKPVS